MAKVETMMHVLKEIQQEKCCLQNKLQEQRSRRRRLEHDLDITRNKLAQVKDVHNKMTETLKVAQFKVAQTQSQAESIEEANQAMRKSIAEKNRRTESLDSSEMKEIISFEENLAAIASKLVTARKFYADENLTEEHNEIDKLKQQIAGKAGDVYNKMLALQSSFDELLLEDGDSLNDSGIEMDIRISARSVFQGENGRAVQVLEMLKSELTEAEEFLHAL